MKQIRVGQKAIISNKEGKILILHRTETAPMLPNTWDLPGGILEHGEHPKEGAQRELKEETGLHVEELELFEIDSVMDGEEHWVVVVYKGSTPSDSIALSYEHDEYRWVTPGEFLEHKASNQLKRFVIRTEIEK